MNRQSDIAESIGRLTGLLNGRDSASLHRMEMTLDLLASAARGDEASGRPAPLEFAGPWNPGILADGTVEWTVRAETSLRERHSWRLKPLSSKRGKDTFRVVLLGSSAAASFGYWGEFTLATALERKLQAVWTERTVEVIDLACVNATWGQILDTMRCAAALAPDVAVVYCGNNEAKMLEARLSNDLRQSPSAFAARWACETEAVADYPALLHACLNEHTANMARATARCARQSGVKLIFVVPEYNLADWRPRERMPFHLSGECSRNWHRRVRDAEDTLANGNAGAALERFDFIIRSDGGLSRRTQWGRAQALKALGKTVEAREAFVRARDTGIGAIADGIPQITNGMAAAMRQTFGELGVPCVDLPNLLGRDSGTGIPDRQQFLDYCHLSARGHDLLAGAIAGQILGDSPPRFVACAPAAKEESLASLVAAIHNFHHGQPQEITRHWLERSIEHWEGIRPLLEFFGDHLCGSWRERFTVEWFRRSGLLDLAGDKYFFFYCKFFYHARFDHEMAELMHDVLRHPPGEKEASFARQTSGLVPDLDRNLLSLFFLDRRQGFATSDRHAARVGWERPALEIYATEPVSTCEFPLDGGTGDLALRLQISPLTQNSPVCCAISVNGVEIATLRIERPRQRLSVVLSRHHLKAGLNRLTFRWKGYFTLADQPPGNTRRRHIKRYGYYPVIARLHEMRVDDGSPGKSPESDGAEKSAEDTGC